MSVLLIVGLMCGVQLCDVCDVRVAWCVCVCDSSKSCNSKVQQRANKSEANGTSFSRATLDYISIDVSTLLYSVLD